jgi:hypothetical protein
MQLSQKKIMVAVSQSFLPGITVCATELLFVEESQVIIILTTDNHLALYVAQLSIIFSKNRL